MRFEHLRVVDIDSNALLKRSVHHYFHIYTCHPCSPVSVLQSPVRCCCLKRTLQCRCRSVSISACIERSTTPPPSNHCSHSFFSARSCFVFSSQHFLLGMATPISTDSSAPTDSDAPSSIPQPKQFYGVYLAAGLSSRFGFRIKCLQPVGRFGETLLELSVRQLIKFGVSGIVIIVSDATYKDIHALVSDKFLGLPVRYAFQKTPAYRKKPMGTVSALLSAAPCLDRPFIVLNGDTLYGESALSQVCAHIRFQDSPCMPGYPLSDVLPKSGKVNRAIIRVEQSSTRTPSLAKQVLSEIVEHYNISMSDVSTGKYSGSELTSMNIFGFQPAILPFAQRKFDDWLAANSTEETKEYILSTMLNDLLPEEKVQTFVYSVNNSVPLELTNPEDFAYVRNNLDLVGL